MIDSTFLLSFHVCPSVLPVLIGFTLKLLLFLSSPSISLSFFYFPSLVCSQNYGQSFISPALSISLLYTPVLSVHTCVHTPTLHNQCVLVIRDSDLCLSCDRTALSWLCMHGVCVCLCLCVPVFFTLIDQIKAPIQVTLPCELNNWSHQKPRGGWDHVFVCQYTQAETSARQTHGNFSLKRY